MSPKSHPPGAPPVLIVDAANVVGSVPDGWWKDRTGATARLRDSLLDVAEDGVPSSRVPEPLRGGPIDVILVVEGQARGVIGEEGVEVVAALGSGDDAIVELAAELGPERSCFVATADRGLIDRLLPFGVTLVGPRILRHRR